jgi:excisionase family DNA binding protein
MRTLDLQECAALLHIGLSTAQELASKGVIPGARIGIKWVFLEDEILAFIRARVREQTEVRRLRAEARGATVEDKTIGATFYQRKRGRPPRPRPVLEPLEAPAKGSHPANPSKSQ